MIRSKLFVHFLLIFAFAEISLGGILYDANGIRIDQSLSGYACVEVDQVLPGVYDIEISNVVASNASILFTISATAPGVKVRNIWVQPCEIPGWPTALVTLVVDEDGGSFDYVENIRKRPCRPWFGCDEIEGDDGTLKVSVYSISGHIGHPVNGGSVTCDQVHWLFSEGGSIYANVLSQTGIDRVYLPNGTSSVYGDLIAVTGNVHRVQAAGSVGTALDPVTISGTGDTANGGVHAHINIDGTVRNMRSYVSDWTGSFDAIKADDTNNPSGLGLGYKITGVTARLMADLTIEEDWSTFLSAEQIAGGVVVRIGEDLNNSAFDPAEEAFQLRAIDGLAGQVIVNAEMAGGDWNGSVLVNTDLNASQPLIDLSPLSTNADQVARTIRSSPRTSVAAPSASPPSTSTSSPAPPPPAAPTLTATPGTPSSSSWATAKK